MTNQTCIYCDKAEGTVTLMFFRPEVYHENHYWLCPNCAKHIENYINWRVKKK